MTFENTPANWLTVSRLLCAPFVAILAWYDNQYALLLFALSAIGDGIDGWIARTFACESKWGELVDPIADKILCHTTIAVLAVKTASISLILPWIILITRDAWLSYERCIALIDHPVSQTAKIKSGILSLGLFLLLTGNLFAFQVVYQVGFVLLLISTYLSLTSFLHYLRVEGKS